MKGKTTYRTGVALCAESAILRNRGGASALLNNTLQASSCVEELVQSSVLLRIELPQVELPLLARENPVVEHDLDHVDELDFLTRHVLDAGLESDQLYRRTPGQALLFQEVSRIGGPDLNSRAAAQVVSRGLVT